MIPEGLVPGLRRGARAWLDLTRAHFAIVWPLLFLAGLALASLRYPGLTWALAGKAALIGLSGFEAGMVLNDIVDRRLDAREVDPRLTRYWRPFGTRPLPAGLIRPPHAMALFCGLVLLAGGLILTLPFPNSVYVGGIMAASYGLEVFYQLRKRHQSLPIAQLLGRVDLALFPVAGYLVLGSPDPGALLLFLVFYPWAEAHLAVNDLADLANDRERGLETVPILLGTDGCVAWIAVFSVVHAGTTMVFLLPLGFLVRAGFTAGFLLLLAANLGILKRRSPEEGLRALPLFHTSLLIYAVALIAGAVV